MLTPGKSKEKGLHIMVRDYFTARYIAESLNIELTEARQKLANERRFSKAELETLEEISGISVKDLLAETKKQS